MQNKEAVNLKTNLWIISSHRRKRKRKKRHEENSCELWDTIKQSNIRIIDIPEREEEKGIEKLFKETVAEHIPNLGRMAVQGYEAQMCPNSFDPRVSSLRCIIIKLFKTKGRILKAAREKGAIT